MRRRWTVKRVVSSELSAAAGQRAVDMRTTNSGGACRAERASRIVWSRALMACRVHSDASRPISFNGWRMVVMPGVDDRGRKHIIEAHHRAVVGNAQPGIA